VYVLLLCVLKEYVADVADIEGKIVLEGALPLSYLLQHMQAVSDDNLLLNECTARSLMYICLSMTSSTCLPCPFCMLY
jgi:hypothetical protein